MDSLIPMCMQNLTTCFIELYDDLLDADVVACTNTRQIILCRSAIPIRSCDIPFDNAQIVRVLYTYDPFEAFILVYNGFTLLVVPYDKTLKIKSTWENVSDVSIGDFLQKGTSQVTIIQNGSKTITDFKEHHEAEDVIPNNLLCNVENFINATYMRLEMCKLQGMKTLEHKRCMIKKMRYALSDNITEAKPLETGRILQKIYNQRWCVIIPVRNKSHGSVTEVNVVMGHDEYLVCQFKTEKVEHLVAPFDVTKSFRIPTSQLNLISNATFQESSEGYITIVAKIPDFVQHSSYNMSGLLRYYWIDPEHGKRELNEQMIGSSELTIEDIQDGSLDAVLTVNITGCRFAVPDMVAVISSSTSSTLCVICRKPINELLCSNLSFQNTMLSNYMVRHSFTSAYGHILISYKINDDYSYSITIYARNEAELVIFIRILSNVFPGTKLSKTHEKITNTMAYDMFTQDLNTLSTFFVSKLPPITTPLGREVYFQIPANEWLEMIKKLKYFNSTHVGEMEKKILAIQNL